jgi:hypothetical protein
MARPHHPARAGEQLLRGARAARAAEPLARRRILVNRAQHGGGQGGSNQTYGVDGRVRHRRRAHARGLRRAHVHAGRRGPAYARQRRRRYNRADWSLGASLPRGAAWMPSTPRSGSSPAANTASGQRARCCARYRFDDVDVVPRDAAAHHLPRVLRPRRLHHHAAAPHRQPLRVRERRVLPAAGLQLHARGAEGAVRDRAGRGGPAGHATTTSTGASSSTPTRARRSRAQGRSTSAASTPAGAPGTSSTLNVRFSDAFNVSLRGAYYDVHLDEGDFQTARCGCARRTPSRRGCTCSRWCSTTTRRSFSSNVRLGWLEHRRHRPVRGVQRPRAAARRRAASACSPGHRIAHSSSSSRASST